MADTTERRLIVQVLLDSPFYCGSNYRLPLRERLKLVRNLEERFSHRGDDRQASMDDGLLVQVNAERIQD